MFFITAIMLEMTGIGFPGVGQIEICFDGFGSEMRRVSVLFNIHEN